MSEEFDLSMVGNDMDRLSMKLSNGDYSQIKKDMNDLAKKISNGLEELPRPFIIEFCGTPKAGKTLCVDVLSKFLSRNGIPVYVVTERAVDVLIFGLRKKLGEYEEYIETVRGIGYRFKE